MAREDGSNREAEESSGGEHDEAKSSRPTASFSMAHALSMIRRRQEDQQRAQKEEEKRLDKEKKLKAREKRRRRRQNQKLRRSNLREKEEGTSLPQPGSDDSQVESVNQLRGLKRSAAETGIDGSATSGEGENDDDDDDQGQALNDDSEISGHPAKKLKTNATTETSADQTTSNGGLEQAKATPTANKLHKQLIPRALLIKRKPPGS